MDEVLDVVNKKDEVIGQALKSECHNNGLWHRGVAIIVINKKGDILIQKRSPKKEKSPNKLCISASGMLQRERIIFRQLKEN
jgi:isopentenyldiphosphate isomerase